MKNRRITLSLLFAAFFAAGAYAQQPVIADEYNLWKSLGVLAVLIAAMVMLYNSSHRKAAKSEQPQAESAEDTKPNVLSEDEVVAAIAMALNEAKGDTHDYENTVITLQKISRNYSPWSSKIFGLRQIPLKK